MEEREKVYRQRALERAKREKEKSSWATQKLEEETKRRKERAAFSAQAPAIPQTTKKCLMKTAQVQARRKQESDDIAREERRDKIRHARQQEAGRALSEVIRRIDRQQGRLVTRETGKHAQEKARESHERYHRALKENKIKLEQVRTIEGHTGRVHQISGSASYYCHHVYLYDILCTCSMKSVVLQCSRRVN